MLIGNLKVKDSILLAPLAGVSNRPFRVLAIKAGASITYTEMVSSEGIVRNQQKTKEYMYFKKDEQPIGIQLFGANPEVMKKAAEITVDEFSPDLIDINFGCPVKKVVNKNGGSAILKDLRLTEDIIKATVEGAGATPVTIKIRTGWDDLNPVYDKVGLIAERSGAKAIALHARSRAKGFSGKADWTSIKKLKETVNIPVIGNGDARTPLDVKKMFDETGCDAVMIGRAAMGNPFIFKQINHYLKTGELLGEPTLSEKIEMARLHVKLMEEQFGEERGAKMMRRYLGWYVKGFKGASELRPLLFQVKTIKDIDRIFADYFQSQCASKVDAI
jgi:tRNA-dihydrouridine synthase B